MMMMAKTLSPNPMAATWIYIGCALLLLCLCASARAAPSVSDLEQLGELERTLKELATSVLAMNGGIAGSGESDIGGPTYWANHIKYGLYFSSGRGYGERFGFGHRQLGYSGVLEQAFAIK